eukprot:COSAG05_NODE_2308_length_3247_cov_3.259530_3_plen_373_part_00
MYLCVTGNHNGGANRLNMLELPWMLGTPMPADLPGQILEAMGVNEPAAPSPAPEEVAAPATTVAAAAERAGMAEDDVLGLPREELVEVLKELGIMSAVSRNKLVKEADEAAAARLQALCTSVDQKEVEAALRTFLGREKMKEYSALQAYAQGELPAIVRVTPAAEALRAGATVASLTAVQKLVTASNTSKVENRTALGTLGAVADVVKAVHEAAAPGGDKRKLGNAVLTLNQLMFQNHANKAAAAAAGATEALVLAVRREADAPEQSALQDALTAMSSLVSHNSAISRETAGAAGAVEAVVAVLRAHPDTEETQERACNTVWSLVCDCDANVARVKSAGARAPVEAARARFPENKGQPYNIQETTALILEEL